MPRLGWDNGRTSILNNTVFWNFGDILSLDGFSFDTGFSTGCAFYATPGEMLRVDMKDIKNVYQQDFAKPFPGDEKPVPKGPTPFWGIGTSNIEEVSPGIGVGYIWQVHRNPNGKFVDKGNGIIRATLGEKMPIAERTGPLVTGPGAIQLGQMCILKAEGYIYTYSNGGAGGKSGLVIGRAKIAEAFNPSAHEFLKTDGSWVKGIPRLDDTSYGIPGKTYVGTGSKGIHSNGPGSIFFSNYFKKYIIFVCAYGNDINFHTSDTPYGPWSEEYRLIRNPGYAITVHPHWSPGGSHKEIYISSCHKNVITMFKVVFDF